MERKCFWITTDGRHPHGDMIYARHNNLRLRVSAANQPDWVPARHEVRLYLQTEERLLVFESVNIQPDDALDVAEAIRWYTAYINASAALIMTADPRMADTPVPVLNRNRMRSQYF